MWGVFSLKDGGEHFPGFFEHLIQPLLLFLLCQKPAHGYELIQRLSSLAFLDAEVDPATVYRNLRRMEQDGLVSSRWEAGGSGPARRLYAVTAGGRAVLKDWMAALVREKIRLEKFIQEYADLPEDVPGDDPGRVVEDRI